MSPRRSHRGGGLQDDNRLSRMVAVSAVLHMVVITALIISTARNRSGHALPIAYTVALVDPAALGTNLPGGGGEKPAAPRPQPTPAAKEPPAAKKEEPKVAQPLQPKEKEAVKLPEKEKRVEKPPVKPEPAKAKLEEKKPEPAKAETPPLPNQEREKQILAAIEKIKGKVEKDSPGGQESGPGSSKSSGPATLGGAPGEGGGGVARGLEFIMYTEQVKRRVKESWIVTEKKPGLSATIRFSVQPDGEVVGIELVKPSGDHAFDQSVMRAISKANPLPPPPQAYQQEFATQKVEVTFGGEEHVN